MNTIKEAFEAVIDAIIANNALTRAEAGDVVETFGPTMSGAAARNWLDAIAVLYQSLGIINNGTYSALRNEIVNEGATVAKSLFGALLTPVTELAETADVATAILEQERTTALGTIDANIALVQAQKTGGANEQLDDAYDQAIFWLEQLKIQLEFELGGL